jgi:hypothetical protein
MDNIQQFLQAATAYGVPEVDLFQSVDLISKQHIEHVTMTIFALGRTVKISKRISSIYSKSKTIVL